jgi:hypothetical protein
MATIVWAGYPVDEQIARKVDAAAERHGVPRNVARAAVLGESEGLPWALGDDGASVGLLQLHEKYQGVGMTRAERADPDRNLSVGMPYIANAWRATAGVSPLRERVRRTMALGGHPGDPDAPGVNREIANRGLDRIMAIWDRLEGLDPSPQMRLDVFGVRVDAGRIEESIARSVAYAREHPGEAAGIAIAAAALALFA